MKYTRNYSEQTDRIRLALRNAEAVVIGAGAGLSTSAGYVYAGARFHENFRDFEEKYGFHDMYSGGFYPYTSLEEYWAYWSRYVYLNRYLPPPKPVYGELLRLVRDRDYFVLTTNVDHCFQRAGFDQARLFSTQGVYGLFQCSVPCHHQTYDTEEQIRRMVAEQKDMKIPSGLIPYCPRCGKPMTMNLRADDTFVQDRGWEESSRRYRAFLRRFEGRRILFLELGVGGNTPVIIKYPFWRMTMQNRNAVYVCINAGEAVCPCEIEGQSVCVNEDIGAVLGALLQGGADAAAD